ncbi:MAG: serine/threonine-protein kinase [Pseudomonadota bacterium]
MKPADFARLDALFNEAVALTGAARDRFIDDRCDGQTAHQLRAMLAADDSGEDLLAAVIALEGEANEPLPTRIGPFEIEGLIGAGGMGRVYRGSRRVDDAVQTVAIKLLQTGVSSPSLIERFRVERSLLARLNHPNIAGLIDAGEAERGLPYVAMEYVDGESLTAYAEHQELRLEAVLALFRQLGEAVAYAHRNLVVHRDLKPDNVIVDAAGHLKLLDFGIAKQLPRHGDAEPGTLTRAGAMTPPYAAPEQIRGEPVTTQSDVYALGVVLYELLTGRLPYRVTADADALELGRQICDTQPQPPSTRQSGARSARLPRRRLRGDLDRIVLKALRKEPERRYESVDALLEDIDRFLEGRPVSARPDALGYRLGKFLTRNPLGAALGVLLLTTLIAFAVTAGWQALRLAEERDRARQEAAAANAVADFMVDIFRVSDPRESASGDLSARDLLDRAAATIEAEADLDPLLRARLMHVIGLSFSNIGDYERGMAMLTGALALRERELGPTSLAVSDSLNRIGNFHRMYGRLDLAEPALERALEIRRSLDLGPSYDLADAHNNFGLFQYELWQNERALQLLDQAIDLHRRSPTPNRASIATAMHNQALALNRLARYSEAKARIEEALALKRELGLEARSTYANSLAVLGTVEQNRGEFQAAWTDRQASLEIRRAVYPGAHPNLVSGLVGLAALAIDRRRMEEADAWLAEALTIALETGGENSLLEARVRMVEGRRGLAKREPAAAQMAFRRAVEIRNGRLRQDHPSRWAAQLGLADALLLAGDPAGAAPLAEAIRQRSEVRFEMNHPLRLEAEVVSAAAALAGNPNAAAREDLRRVAAAGGEEPAWAVDRLRIRALELLARFEPGKAPAHRAAAAALAARYGPLPGDPGKTPRDPGESGR